MKKTNSAKRSYKLTFFAKFATWNKKDKLEQTEV